MNKQHIKRWSKGDDSEGGVVYTRIKATSPQEALTMFTWSELCMAEGGNGPGQFFAGYPYCEGWKHGAYVISQTFGYDI